MWCTLSLLAPNAITAISRGGELFAERRVTEMRKWTTPHHTDITVICTKIQYAFPLQVHTLTSGDQKIRRQHHGKNYHG